MIYFDYYRLPRFLVLIIIASSVLLLSSMTSSREVMNPEIKMVPGTDYPIPFELSVRGASAGIQADYFEQSIVEAIIASDIFSGLDDSTGKPYSLNIRIIRVDAPTFSYKMTVVMNVIWELVHAADGVEVLHENIQSSYTGGAFEGGLIGANRVRVAAEGAARENIRLGLEKIASLDL